MKRKHVFFLSALAVLVAAWFIWRAWEAKPPTAEGRTAELRVQADSLYAAFVQDENAAGQRYNDKLVEVDGVVRSVNSTDSLAEVLLETGDPMGAVVCALAPGERTTLTAGALARIQGYCAGYNMDVLLQRCAVLETPEKH